MKKNKTKIYTTIRKPFNIDDSLPIGVIMAAYRYAVKPFTKNIRTFNELILNWTISGSVKVKHNGKTMIMNAGDVFINKIGKNVTYTVNGDFWESRWIAFDDKGFKSWQKKSNIHKYKAGPCPEDLFMNLEQELDTLGRNAQAQASSTAFKILTKAISTKEYLETKEDIISKAERVIIKNLQNPELNVNWLVQNLKLERTSFSRRFSRETGLSPIEYITKKRIQTALTLLKTSHLSISEIALATGYQDVNYFSRIIKKETGKTAKENKAEF